MFLLSDGHSVRTSRAENKAESLGAKEEPEEVQQLAGVLPHLFAKVALWLAACLCMRYKTDIEALGMHCVFSLGYESQETLFRLVQTKLYFCDVL